MYKNLIGEIKKHWPVIDVPVDIRGFKRSNNKGVRIRDQGLVSFIFYGGGFGLF